MDRRRVVVTGIGVISPVGHGVDGFWDGISSGRCGIKQITRFDTSQIRAKVAGQIDDFDPLEYLDARLSRRVDRFAQMALASTEMALADAAIRFDPTLPDPRAGVTMGTALGGIPGAEKQHRKYLSDGIKGVDPSLALIVFGGSGSSNIAIRYGLTGPSNANSNSCASGAIAVGEAYRYIKDGHADLMVAASAEAPLEELTFSAFALIRAMSTNPDPETACRPFDRERDGFVMGEAAAVLILEELGHAQRRDAHIYAEIRGYACNNDAHHMLEPRPDGSSALRAMADALREGGVSAADVGYVNAHASATVLNDRVETFALRALFGERAAGIPVSGTKSMHAHALGATGALEAAISCLALKREFLPPTIHLRTPDPECDLDCIPNKGRSIRVDYVLSNSFGFGGINAALVFGRFDQ